MTKLDGKFLTEQQVRDLAPLPSQTKQSFNAWMRAVNVRIYAATGMGYEDLPDCNYRSWFDDGVSARTAAARAVRYAKGGE